MRNFFAKRPAEKPVLAPARPAGLTFQRHGDKATIIVTDYVEPSRHARVEGGNPADYRTALQAVMISGSAIIKTNNGQLVFRHVGGFDGLVTSFTNDGLAVAGTFDMRYLGRLIDYLADSDASMRREPQLVG